MARVFYFTGTGNSLHTARLIAQKLGGETESIVSALKNDKFYDDEVIGIVVPIYFVDIPNLVKEFLKKVNLAKKSYIFCVVTCAAIDGRALNRVNTLLKERNLSLSYAARVFLPDNFIAAATKEAKKLEMFAKYPQEIEKISAAILQYQINSDHYKKEPIELVQKAATGFYNTLYKTNNKTINYTKCTKCGICQKVCPVDNINLINERFEIGNKCENCFACAQWCPNRAISMGKLTPDDKTQYNHPDITVQDLIKQKTAN